MAGHHYVSKFHLREFCDPAGATTPDPWLWVGELSSGSVKRRAPKNVGTAADLFAGPGGFADQQTSIEGFLATEVEGPASHALREMSRAAVGTITDLPPAITRYLAWAAARALPMQRLQITWNTRFAYLDDEPLVEPPPKGLTGGPKRHRPVQLIHPILGGTTVAPSEDPSSFFDAGWIPDPAERANFLEAVHVQAYYFQARWFPRLLWSSLRPPQGKYFIIGDRPVGWGVPDCLDAPPCCLRDPSAFLIAPLTHSLALVGRNNCDPWSITPAQVNAILATWSHEWIAGPTAECVAEAIRDRLGDPVNQEFDRSMFE